MEILYDITKQAVVEFQKANDIAPAIGVVGPITTAKLKEFMDNL